MLLAVIFVSIVIYLRCCQKSTSRPNVGFQRYEPLLQDEEDYPVIQRINERKSSRINKQVFNESDDEDDQTLFSSQINRKQIP